MQKKNQTITDHKAIFENADWISSDNIRCQHLLGNIVIHSFHEQTQDRKRLATYTGKQEIVECMRLIEAALGSAPGNQSKLMI